MVEHDVAICALLHMLRTLQQTQPVRSPGQVTNNWPKIYLTTWPATGAISKYDNAFVTSQG